MLSDYISFRLMIEFVVRNTENKGKIEKFREILFGFDVSEFDGKLIIDVPLNWYGLNDGRFKSLIDLFGESLYVALAFVATEGEVVRDLYGDYVDKYYTVIDGRKVPKYVKKNLRIMKVNNKENNEFEIQSYTLDVCNSPPIFKILDVYSGGRDSGVKLNMFLSGNK